MCVCVRACVCVCVRVSECVCVCVCMCVNALIKSLFALSSASEVMWSIMTSFYAFCG